MFVLSTAVLWPLIASTVLLHFPHTSTIQWESSILRPGTYCIWGGLCRIRISECFVSSLTHHGSLTHSLCVYTLSSSSLSLSFLPPLKWFFSGCARGRRKRKIHERNPTKDHGLCVNIPVKDHGLCVNIPASSSDLSPSCWSVEELPQTEHGIDRQPLWKQKRSCQSGWRFRPCKTVRTALLGARHEAILVYTKRNQRVGRFQHERLRAV